MQWALAFFRDAAAQSQLVWAPTIIIPELASALRRHATGQTTIMSAVRHFAGQPNLRLVDIDRTLAARAAELVADLGLRGCDAVYVALAESLDDELVTLDRDQLRAATQLVRARLP